MKNYSSKIALLLCALFSLGSLKLSGMENNLTSSVSILEKKFNQLADLLNKTQISSDSEIPTIINKPTIIEKPIFIEEPNIAPKKQKIPIKKPEKPSIEVEIPSIKIPNLMGLDTGYLKPLELMKSGTDHEKALKKAQAKGILNGILTYVKSDKFKSENQTTIKAAVDRILAIDPLLISTAAIILREAKIPMPDNYTMMTDYYKERIKFIEKELGNVIKRSGTAHKGLREDIDDALSYPIELEGEIQRAKTIIEFSDDNTEKQQAQVFIERVNELREWLLNLLKKEENKKILLSVDLPVDFYIDIFENKTNQVYCVTQVKPESNTVYKPFIEDLKEIIIDITEYKEGSSKFTRSLKIYKLQSIINKLKGFLAHATEESYCQICLKDDIQKIKQLNQIGEFDINATFKTIRDFLQNIYNTEKNEAVLLVINETLPKLKEAISNKGCTINN